MLNAFSPHDLPLPRSRVAAVLIAAVAIALIGRLDYETSYDTTVIVLYLLPIALAAWVGGSLWGVVAAFGSATLSLFGDLLVAAYHNPFVPYWNAAAQFSVFALFAIALAALRRSIEREHVASRVDYVTQLANSRAFHEAADAELARMRRFGRSLTLVYMDADRFKTVNDTRGHAEGDRLLRVIAEALRATTREVDTVARIGGDEFIVLLPETGPEAAERAVNRMRSSLDAAAGAGDWGITMSFGAATFLEPPESIDEMVRSADRLLYDAKKAGRDRAVHATFGKCA